MFHHTDSIDTTFLLCESSTNTNFQLYTIIPVSFYMPCIAHITQASLGYPKRKNLPISTTTLSQPLCIEDAGTRPNALKQLRTLQVIEETNYRD